MVEERTGEKWLGRLYDVLKCEICLGMMRTSVLLPQCAHSFCSLCIRRSLTFVAKCPVCRKPARSSQLVKNRALETLVELARKMPLHVSGGGKDATDRCAGSNGHAPAKCARSRKKLDYFFAPSKHTRDGRIQKVECPVCHVSVFIELINQHLDVCMGRSAINAPSDSAVGHSGSASELSTPASSSAALLTPKEYKAAMRAQAVVYNLVGTSKLRQMLVRCGLRDSGPRGALIRRHREFLVQVSAEADVDAAKRASREEIVNRVHAHESNAGSRSCVPGRTLDMQRKSEMIRALGRRVRHRQHGESSDDSRNQPQQLDDDPFAGLISQLRTRERKRKRKRERERELVSSSSSLPLSLPSSASLTNYDTADDNDDSNEQVRDAPSFPHPWRAVWCDRLQCVFFWNAALRIGQFQQPKPPNSHSAYKLAPQTQAAASRAVSLLQAPSSPPPLSPGEDVSFV